MESKGVGLCVWSPGNFIDAFSTVRERPILLSWPDALVVNTDSASIPLLE